MWGRGQNSAGDFGVVSEDFSRAPAAPEIVNHSNDFARVPEAPHVADLPDSGTPTPSPPSERDVRRGCRDGLGGLVDPHYGSPWERAAPQGCPQRQATSCSPWERDAPRHGLGLEGCHGPPTPRSTPWAWERGWERCRREQGLVDPEYGSPWERDVDRGGLGGHHERQPTAPSPWEERDCGDPRRGHAGPCSPWEHEFQGGMPRHGDVTPTKRFDHSVPRARNLLDNHHVRITNSEAQEVPEVDLRKLLQKRKTQVRDLLDLIPPPPPSLLAAATSASQRRSRRTKRLVADRAPRTKVS